MPELRQRLTDGFGWIPDPPDCRDFLYRIDPTIPTAIPSSVNLRQMLPDPYTQGRIQACTANATAAACEFDMRKQDLTLISPSRLFIYYNARYIEGTVGTDSGAMIRDCVKVLAKLGVCAETDWPYDAVAPFRSKGVWPTGSRGGRRPSLGCYRSALRSRTISYKRIPQTLANLKGCLAEGYPFVFGFTTYESFLTAAGGSVTLPEPNEHVAGSHAAIAAGYDDATARFLIQNSWGPDWGNHGYFTLPYEYLTRSDLSADFWTLRTIL